MGPLPFIYGKFIKRSSRSKYSARLLRFKEGIFPPGLESHGKRMRFVQRWRDFRVVEWASGELVAKDAPDDGRRLYYGPLQVVAAEEVTNLLLELMKDPLTRKMSRDSLFNYVKVRYIGIRRRDVMEFLRNYELHHASNPIVPCPWREPRNRHICTAVAGAAVAV